LRENLEKFGFEEFGELCSTKEKAELWKTLRENLKCDRNLSGYTGGNSLFFVKFFKNRNLMLKEVDHGSQNSKLYSLNV
jgi:hypothetical protein